MDTVPTLQYRSSLMMFWGYLSLTGTGQLFVIRGIMKSEDYIQMKIYNYQYKILI